MRRSGSVGWIGSIAGEMLLILFVIALVPQIWQAEARRLRAQSRFEDMEPIARDDRAAGRFSNGGYRRDQAPAWHVERLEPADLDETGEYIDDVTLPPVETVRRPAFEVESWPRTREYQAGDFPSRELPPRIPQEATRPIWRPSRR